MKAVFDLCRQYFLPLAALSYVFGFTQSIYSLVRFGTFQDLDWKLAQFNVSYFEYGFIKRGLVGTLLSPVFGNLRDDPGAQKLAIVLFNLSLFGVFILFAAAYLRKIEEAAPEMAGWFRVLLVLSPFGIMQWSHDMGRLDHVNLLVLGLAVGLLTRRRPFAASAALLCAVLVHEGVLFYGFPLIFAAIALVHKDGPLQDRMKIWLITLGPATILALLVGKYGDITDGVLYEQLAKTGPGARAWQRGLLEPANLSFKQSLLCVTYILAIWAIFTGPLLRLYGRGVTAALVLGPLPLFVLGIDYFRWLHLILFLLAAAFCFAVLSRPNGRGQALTAEQRLSLGLCAIPLGPIGVQLGLPFVHALVN